MISGASGGLHVSLSPRDPDQTLIQFFDGEGKNLDRGGERKIESIFAREDFRRSHRDAGPPNRSTSAIRPRTVRANSAQAPATRASDCCHAVSTSASGQRGGQTWPKVRGSAAEYHPRPPSGSSTSRSSRAPMSSANFSSHAASPL